MYIFFQFSGELSENEVHEVNRDMGFENTKLQLSVTDFENNKPLREHFKLMLNAALGKFAQKNCQKKIQFVKNHKELLDVLSRNEVIDVSGLTEDICQVHVNENTPSTPPNSNAIIYAFITARARISIHKQILALSKTKDCRVFYCDTDNIIFSSPENLNPFPVPVGPSFGKFKKELGSHATIDNFVAHGRKNLKISFQSQHTKETIYKVKGVSLKSTMAKSVFEKHFTNFENMADSRKIPQARQVCSKSFDTRTHRQDFTFHQNIECQRYVEMNDPTKKNTTLGLQYKNKCVRTVL